MDASSERQVRHHIKQAYPMVVVACGTGFRVGHPDLPGCSVEGPKLPRLYVQLEAARTAWIRAAVSDGTVLPRPNHHLQRPPRRTVRL